MPKRHANPIAKLSTNAVTNNPRAVKTAPMYQTILILFLIFSFMIYPYKKNIKLPVTKRMKKRHVNPVAKLSAKAITNNPRVVKTAVMYQIILIVFLIFSFMIFPYLIFNLH